jgi:hypothetical protein
MKIFIVMNKFKNLNNISEELEKQIPKLENGQEVVFQMLNGHINNDMDRDERERNPILYGKTQLATKITIKDPYNKKIVDVGVPQAIDRDNVVSFKPYLTGLNQGIFTGKFSLIGGKIQDEEFFEVFWLSPEREGSPCQDANIQPIFKILEAKKESQKTLNKLETLKKALNVMGDMTDEQLTEFAASKNISGDIDHIKMEVGKIAKGEPDKFLAANEDPNKEIKANLKKAIDKNVLVIDLVTKKVSTGNSILFTLKQDEGVDELTAIAMWINSAANGKKVYEGILKQIKDK